MQGSMEMALGYPHDRHICRGALRMPGIQEASMGLLHLLAHLTVHLFVHLSIDLLFTSLSTSPLTSLSTSYTTNF